MNAFTIAAYGDGMMCPPLLWPNIITIQPVGCNAMILGLCHISRLGDIGFNGAPIIATAMGGSSDVGDTAWSGQLVLLITLGNGPELQTVRASIGGGGESDVRNVQRIFLGDGNSRAGIALQASFGISNATFPMISLIDMGLEEGCEQASFMAFCQVLIELGHGIPHRPSAWRKSRFRVGSQAALNVSNYGAVKSWNLQCYGNGNDPDAWAQAIPGFDTTGHIEAGDWSRTLAEPTSDPDASLWEGDGPAAMRALLASIKTKATIDGLGERP